MLVRQWPCHSGLPSRSLQLHAVCLQVNFSKCVQLLIVRTIGAFILSVLIHASMLQWQ